MIFIISDCNGGCTYYKEFNNLAIAQYNWDRLTYNSDEVDFSISLQFIMVDDHGAKSILDSKYSL